MSDNAEVIDKKFAKVKGLQKEICGIYVHKFVAYHVASWINPYYMLQIINIVSLADNAELKNELAKKNQLINEKDDKIDQLQDQMAKYKAELEAQMAKYNEESQRKLDQMTKSNQEAHTKLDRVLDQNDELKEQNDTLQNDIEKLDNDVVLLTDNIVKLDDTVNVLHNDIIETLENKAAVIKEDDPTMFAVIKLYSDLATLESKNLALSQASTDEYLAEPENMYRCIKRQRSGLEKEKARLLRRYNELSVVVEMEVPDPLRFCQLFWQEIEPYLYRADLKRYEFTTFNADDTELIALCQKIKYDKIGKINDRQYL